MQGEKAEIQQDFGQFEAENEPIEFQDNGTAHKAGSRTGMNPPEPGGTGCAVSPAPKEAAAGPRFSTSYPYPIGGSGCRADYRAGWRSA